MSSGLRTRYNLQEGSRACISTCTVGPLQVNLRRVREDHSFCADYSTTPKTTPSVGPVSQLPTSRLVVQWPKTSSDWVPAFSSCSPQSTRSCPPIIPHPCCSCFAHSSPFASCSRYPLCPFHPMLSHPIPSHPIPSASRDNIQHSLLSVLLAADGKHFGFRSVTAEGKVRARAPLLVGETRRYRCTRGGPGHCMAHIGPHTRACPSISRLSLRLSPSNIASSVRWISVVLILSLPCLSPPFPLSSFPPSLSLSHVPPTFALAPHRTCRRARRQGSSDSRTTTSSR